MDISVLSVEDYVRIVANYNYLSSDENKTSNELNSRGYSEHQLALAADQIAERFSSVTSCGLRFTKPFGHLKYDFLNYVLILYENYERGALPFPGTASEQPAQIMEIFSSLRQLKHEAEMKAVKSASSHSRSKRQ
jgi:hypothetical protein